MGCGVAGGGWLTVGPDFSVGRWQGVTVTGPLEEKSLGVFALKETLCPVEVVV